MDKTNNKSIETKSSYQDKAKKQLFIGGIIVLLMAISPLLFYIYESFPSTQVWETSFFKIETTYANIYTLAWYLTGKVVPIYLLLLWFFTCKHWWHWIILLPLATYIFQIWGIINESKNVDEVELIYMFPLMLVIIPLVYLIRSKIFFKVLGDDLELFEEELNLRKSKWVQIKNLFR